MTAINPKNLTTSKRLLVIIPAYNEEHSVASTVKEVKKNLPNAKILVVSDGSKDATVKQAWQSGAQCLDLPFNLGIGGAVQTGFKVANQEEFDIAIQVDGDGQHDCSFLASLIEPLLKDQADMAIGSRFIKLHHSDFRSSFVRRIGIRFFSWLISLLTHSHVTDPTSGFRAINKPLIKVFAQYYPSDFPEPEAILVARRYQARIVEVPVSMRKRVTGASSIRYLKTLYYMIKVTFAILLDKLKSSRRFSE